METGTSSFRFVTLAVLASLGWSLWVTCTDGMVLRGMADDMAVDGAQDKPSSVMSVMNAVVMAGADCLMGDPDCCTMTKPFLTLGKSAPPRPELTATVVSGSCLLTSEFSRFHHLSGSDGESPPGIADPTYLTISVLRI